MYFHSFDNLFTAKLSKVLLTAFSRIYIPTTAVASSSCHVQTTCYCSLSSRRASMDWKVVIQFAMTWKFSHMKEGDGTRTALWCRRSCWSMLTWCFGWKYESDTRQAANRVDRDTFTTDSLLWKCNNLCVTLHPLILMPGPRPNYLLITASTPIVKRSIYC